MKLFGKKQEEKPAADAGAEAIECEHITLIPSWDSAEDMGQLDRASQFRCEACGDTFAPAEAERLRATESERLHRKLAS
jgi:hypothetical protein